MHAMVGYIDVNSDMAVHSLSSQAHSGAEGMCEALGASKEGVLLRNVSAAPIWDHFAVLPPSSWIREPVRFLV